MRPPQGWRFVVWVLVAVAVACAHPLPPPTSPPAPPPLALNPAELVVVVPDLDGTVGALTVVIDGAEQTLARPYVAAKTSPEGQVDVAVLGEAEVQAVFAFALAARPVRAKTFLLYFTFGTDALTATSAQSLPRILTEIAQTPAVEVRVVGHTDRTGTELENDLLSAKRAERVRQDLIQRGVAAEVVETVGRGSRDATGDAAQDRRVDIVVR